MEVTPPTPLSDLLCPLPTKMLAERDRGNAVLMTFDGIYTVPVSILVDQPADGILYDLNRLEEVALTLLPKDVQWVNNFAVALVVRELKDQLESANKRLAEAEATTGRVRETGQALLDAANLRLAEAVANAERNPWTYRKCGEMIMANEGLQKRLAEAENAMSAALGILQLTQMMAGGDPSYNEVIAVLRAALAHDKEQP